MQEALKDALQEALELQVDESTNDYLKLLLLLKAFSKLVLKDASKSSNNKISDLLEMDKRVIEKIKRVKQQQSGHNLDYEEYQLEALKEKYQNCRIVRQNWSFAPDLLKLPICILNKSFEGNMR